MNQPLVELQDICRFISGGTPSTKVPEYFAGTIPWITGADMNGNVITEARQYITEEAIQHSATNIVPKGNILLVTRTGVGKVAIAGVDICISQDFTGLELDKTKVDEWYLFYFLLSQQEALTSQQRGATIQGITRDVVETLRIPLPPLTEQKRIASLLARADRLRQLRRTAHDLGDALLQSVFLEMFGDVAHSKWDKSELGELIEGFEAGVNYLPGSEGEKTSEWRVLKISAVTWGDFDPTESKAIREYDKFDEKHIVRKGDLLISRANTTELVGAVSLVKIIPSKVLLPDKLWRVKFREDSTILPEYTLHVLRQPELRKIIGDLATGSSGSMKNISMEKAYTLPIPVPPLSLQEEFAGVVARVESLRGRMGESTRQVEGLFESLLAQSFDGGR
ncbi:MAG: restriction endonuclease subunit S [Anaerolineales bacterium]|nr:restriction endonuclease subunit S [Anaerolineales bacterium]